MITLSIVDRILDIKALGMPIGSSLLLTAAFGLSDGLTTLVDQLSKGMIPPALTPVAIAAAINNITPVKNFMGSELAELVSVAALTAGINQQFNVTGMVRGLVNQLTSLVPGVGVSTPVLAPTATTEPMAGYSMGNPSITMGQVSEAQNIDDVDMLLLSARGYQTA